MTLPSQIDLKDAVIVAGFIGTCAVLLYRVRVAEKAIADHEARLREVEKAL